MDWMQGITWLIALGSLSVAVWARCDAAKARAEAKRSADAAQKTAGITEDLYEQGKFKFSLERTDNSLTRWLINGGTHTAYDISVSAPSFEAGIVQEPPIDLHTGTPIKITARIPSGLRDKRLIVKFKEDRDGPERSVTLYV